MSSNKYNAVATWIDDPLTGALLRFDSKAEARRYQELCLLVRAGQITGLERQPNFPLYVNGVQIGAYRADFRYRDEATGAVVIEDVKGVATDAYRMKKKLMYALHGIQVQEVAA